ncbi:hypothetical protein G7Y89_g13792 [Cudoniella acicularis]|uniref:Alpha/beta hydrolase fold-3 domain-containing protein n=1 Tax=Cudoniella acicularis TaxID=354080 RepID=A0A8H4R690_9HELO|nr:hypothetical protein G7Y89_g13792 [Cudoniella acicularis]
MPSKNSIRTARQHAIPSTEPQDIKNADVVALTTKKWPAQRDVVMNLYNYALSNISVSPSKLIIGGDSAGGNLALLTLLHLRSEKKPLPAATILYSPSIDLAASLTQHAPNIANYFMFTFSETTDFMNNTLRPENLPFDPPEISALLHEDISGLPPQLIFWSTMEVLASDSERWVAKSRKVGVETVEWKEDGMLHTFALDFPFVGKKNERNYDEMLLEYHRMLVHRGSKTCYENNYPSNYRQWGCGWNATSILFTYPGQADGDTIQQAFIGTKELEAVNTVTVTSIAMTMITTSDPNAPTAASQSSNSGVSTGTIVGATMGSAAILAIGAVIVTILIFRHRKKHLGQQPLPGTMDTPNMGTGTDIGASPVSGMHSGHPSTVGTGTYYPKDPYSAVSSPSQGYLQTPSSVTGHGHGDMVYHQSYQPSQMSPQIPPLSPEPREMDAGGP